MAIQTKKIQLKAIFPEASKHRGLEETYREIPRNLGAYFDGPQVGTGLEPIEKVILLPRILNIMPTDMRFEERCAEYFNDKVVKIRKKGIELDITLMEDNNKPISETNLPINVSDYITWRWCLRHPKVSTEADASNIFAILVDPQKVKEDIIKEANISDTALKLYLDIKERADYDKAKMILGAIVRNQYYSLKNYELMNGSDIMLDLRKLSDESPDHLVYLYNDKDLEIRYNMAKMIKRGAIKIIEGKVINSKDSTKYANSPTEFIAFIKDPFNVKTVNELKAIADIK